MDKYLAEVKTRAERILEATPIPQRSGFYCKAPEGFIYREHEILQAKDSIRLVAMVEGRDAEIARLLIALDSALLIRAEFEAKQYEVDRLRKQLAVARDKFTTLLNDAEICIGLTDFGGLGGLRASAVKESITQALAELDRLAGGGE